MTKHYQSIRGMNDLLPDDSAHWQSVEAIVKAVIRQYGYQEIRLPIMEFTEVFSRSIGSVTDIVEKEMYTFLDRNGDSLSLRPEGTAGCVRAAIQHGLLHNQTQRLWYDGPMFRHERPQKGRYRQFYQFGVECFGFSGPDVDAELIMMSARCWERLGLGDRVVLQLNSLGSFEARKKYREVLVAYMKTVQSQLDADSQKRLHTNPLRILDSKNPAMQTIIDEAPSVLDYLDEDSVAHFEQLQGYLSTAGIAFQIAPRLVRGLDYYNRTVFEWIAPELGSQGTICAGGRYDGLVSQLGGKPTPAAGFALGVERVVSLSRSDQRKPNALADVYLIHDTAPGKQHALSLAEQIRTRFPSIRVICYGGEGSFKRQFKQADKALAKIAVIVGADELNNQYYTVKLLQVERPQEHVAHEKLMTFLETLLLEQT